MSQERSGNSFLLAPFLETLASDGIRPTLNDYRRIALVLGTGGEWSVARLRAVLITILVRDRKLRPAFEHRFDVFFPPGREATLDVVDVARALADLRMLAERPVVAPVDASAEPGTVAAETGTEAPGRWLRSPRRRRWVYGIGHVLAVLMVMLIGPVSDVEKSAPRGAMPPAPARVEDNAPAAEPPPPPPPPQQLRERLYSGVPIVKSVEAIDDGRPDPLRNPWLWATAALLLANLLYWWGVRVWSGAPRGRVPDIPADRQQPFRASDVGGAPEARLNAETLDVLADLVGHVDVTGTGRRIDVPVSIHATLDLGAPCIIHQPGQRLRRVMVLEDTRCGLLALNPVARELASGLAARGIEVVAGQFNGVPDRFLTPEQELRNLDDFEESSNDTILLVFSDAKGLDPHRHRPLLEDLALWPMAVWMEPREPRAWDDSTTLPARAGLPVHPADGPGLIAAFRGLLSERGAAAPALDTIPAWRGLPLPPPDQARLPAHLERVLGDALGWAQACAMVPPPLGPGLADGLRRAFRPDLPVERYQRLLALPGTTVTSDGGLHFTLPVLSALRQGFALRHTPEAQKKILAFLLEALERAEPRDAEENTARHQIWRWKRARLLLEMRPAEALRELGRLARGGLERAIRADLAQVAHRGDNHSTRLPLLAKLDRLDERRLFWLQGRRGRAVSPRQWVMGTALGTALLATGGWSGWTHWQANQAPLHVQVDSLDGTEFVASLDGGDDAPLIEGITQSSSYTVSREKSYRLNMVSKGGWSSHDIDVGTSSLRIGVAAGEMRRPCHESKPFVIDLCPGGENDQASYSAPSWGESLGPDAPPNYYTSIAFVHPDQGQVRELLLATGSADIVVTTDQSPITDPDKLRLIFPWPNIARVIVPPIKDSTFPSRLAALLAPGEHAVVTDEEVQSQVPDMTVWLPSAPRPLVRPVTGTGTVQMVVNALPGTTIQATFRQGDETRVHELPALQLVTIPLGKGQWTVEFRGVDEPDAEEEPVTGAIDVQAGKTTVVAATVYLAPSTVRRYVWNGDDNAIAKVASLKRVLEAVESAKASSTTLRDIYDIPSLPAVRPNVVITQALRIPAIYYQQNLALFQAEKGNDWPKAREAITALRQYDLKAISEDPHLDLHDRLAETRIAAAQGDVAAANKALKAALDTAEKIKAGKSTKSAKTKKSSKIRTTPLLSVTDYETSLLNEAEAAVAALVQRTVPASPDIASGTSVARAEATQQVEPTVPASPSVAPGTSDTRTVATLVVTTVPASPSITSGTSGAKQLAKDCAYCPEMVAVPGGEFMMGSPKDEPDRRPDEGPQHKVTVLPFAIGKYEVTFAEWDACVADGGCNGYRPEDRGWGRDRRPVINVSWDDAQAYAQWLSRKTGHVYRLPSEAEWEYAARAGTTTPFHFGQTISTDQANYDGNYSYGIGIKGEYRRQTVPVGRFPANAFGLYDIHGNVREWVGDGWHSTYDGAPVDGGVWRIIVSFERVVRGGSWNYLPGSLRSAMRDWVDTGTRISNLGFRIARTL
ncbi:MAG: formylglycine-generating enzyme family protein [Alphaproteobacteria bacterium]